MTEQICQKFNELFYRELFPKLWDSATLNNVYPYKYDGYYFIRVYFSDIKSIKRRSNWINFWNNIDPKTNCFATFFRLTLLMQGLAEIDWNDRNLISLRVLLRLLFIVIKYNERINRSVNNVECSKRLIKGNERNSMEFNHSMVLAPRCFVIEVGNYNLRTFIVSLSSNLKFQTCFTLIRLQNWFRNWNYVSQTGVEFLT